MPARICTTTIGAKSSVRPSRHTSQGRLKMIVIAIRKISVLFMAARSVGCEPAEATAGST